MAAEDKACILDMSSLGSLMLAILLAELALKRQFGKDSRKGKARKDYAIRENFMTTGL